MLAKTQSAAVLGVDAYPVDVEVDLASGLPAYVKGSLKAYRHGGVKCTTGYENKGAPRGPLPDP